MANSRSGWWKSVSNNLFSSGIYGIIAMVGVALLSRYGSTWTHPIIQGLLAGLFVFFILLAWRAIRLLPPTSDRTTLDNVEEKVLGWLHRSNLGVRRDPTDKTFFRFIVTTEADRKIIIGRPREQYPDYIHLRAEITTTEKDKETLAKFSKYDEQSLLLDLKLELARACIGYSGLGADGVVIFKKIPISHSLSEDAVINAIWEMEAMINLILVVGARAFQKYQPDTQLVLETK